jgi:hypothetical protein
MTPQSELTRLLGIPPELWEGELKGMSDEESAWGEFVFVSKQGANFRPHRLEKYKK